jgi:GlpG protein
MRLIGTIDGDKHAATFSDYLYTRGIENTVERNDANLFDVWVADEEKLEEAANLLKQFIANPVAPEYAKAPDSARRQRAKEIAEAEAAEERVFDSREILTRQRTGAVFVTALLIVISISVGLFTKLGEDVDALQPWMITKYEISGPLLRWEPGLPEVKHGEVWRLITPMFVHFGGLHLFFNMYWLLFLGSMIERSIGSGRLLLFVLVIAVLSNLAEYGLRLPPLSNGAPNFGGMSGVVYALFGFAWMKSKYDFASGIEIQPSTAAMMLIWYFVCLVGVMPVANMVHTVGLVGGIGWGYVSARSNLRR